MSRGRWRRPAHPVNQQVTASTSSCEPVQAVQAVQAVQYAPPVLETVDGSDHRLDRAVFGLGGRGDVAGQRLNTSRRLSSVRTTHSSPSPSVRGEGEDDREPPPTEARPNGISRLRRVLDLASLFIGWRSRHLFATPSSARRVSDKPRGTTTSKHPTSSDASGGRMSLSMGARPQPWLGRTRCHPVSTYDPPVCQDGGC